MNDNTLDFFEFLMTKSKEENLDVTIYFENGLITSIETSPHDELKYEVHCPYFDNEEGDDRK